jgi:hypothetical protein
VFEPFNKISLEFKTDKRYDLSWLDPSKNYIINEKYYPGCGNLSQLLTASDKVICIFREDSKQQIESFVVADLTNEWRGNYSENDPIIENIDLLYKNKKDYFLTLKEEFREFRELYKLKTFSYEDLYYRGKIDEFKEYLNLDITDPFPYGEKYRIESVIKRLI